MNASFWEACRPSNASAVWTTIWYSRFILEKGSRWRIGNGINVSVWHDRWITTSTTFKPYSPCPDEQLKDLKVSDLMVQQGQWNVGLIRSIFFKEEAKSIINIPLSQRNLEDKIVWHYNKFVNYSSKSGYFIARSNLLSSNSKGSSCGSSSIVHKGPMKFKGL